uniref:telomere length and silencing protein 1 homolog n=1 Tax=Ciona intestinalis TaxID=7719 RepID=UPI00006A5FB5|nr:telomere length and silencing protein 1 homolog [Ciona intestinalis]|eukprot:XP_002128903.1 telomere length and silencing protein 1 homolog [Ciona intestinalis]
MPTGKQKQFRRKRDSSPEEEPETEDVRDMLEATKELQKIRKRQMGVNAVSLATGAKLKKVDNLDVEADPFKMTTGGLVEMGNVKDRNRDRTYEDVDRDVTNLGHTFSVETNRRDEDAELTAYIENELKRRKGETSNGDDKKAKESAEDKLYQLPEHLQIKVGKQSEEMLSNQMLSGIPEVDLGIDTKIKNIERTEEAKQKLITELSKKKEKRTSFVPTNMAVNYVQHKRFMHNDGHKNATKKEPETEAPPLVVGDSGRRPASEVAQHRADNSGKSTDNFHYDKFRKAARRF